MLQAMTILDVDNDWVKLEKLLAWQLTKVKSKKGVILGAQTEQTKSLLLR